MNLKTTSPRKIKISPNKNKISLYLIKIDFYLNDANSHQKLSHLTYRAGLSRTQYQLYIHCYDNILQASNTMHSFNNAYSLLIGCGSIIRLK